MELSQVEPSGEKLNSISRERLNFRRRPILCTTLYRNPMQASNFGGIFDQLFLRIFIKFSQKMPLYLFYTMVQKSQKWPKTQIKGGPALILYYGFAKIGTRLPLYHHSYAWWIWPINRDLWGVNTYGIEAFSAFTPLQTPRGNYTWHVPFLGELLQFIN